MKDCLVTSHMPANAAPNSGWGVAVATTCDDRRVTVFMSRVMLTAAIRWRWNKGKAVKNDVTCVDDAFLGRIMVGSGSYICRYNERSAALAVGSPL